jgi:hypothetical protein
MANEFTTASGKVLKLEPFVLNCTRQVLPKVRELQKPPLDDAAVDAQADLKVDILVEGLRRANPDVTKDWLLENVQSQELDGLVLAVLEVSGLTLKKVEQPAGEAPSPQK